MVRALGVVAFLGILHVVGCAPTLPENTPIKEARWLGQNWNVDERHWYHHASQGTSTLPVPYDWFIALEQPTLSITGDPGLISDSDYLRRLGFIPSPKSLVEGSDNSTIYGYTEDGGSRKYGTAGSYDASAFNGNPDGLPVGFARTSAFVDPVTGEEGPDQIGLTCAACHTGHLEYQGVSLRIDGAPAMINLGKLREILGWALFYTRYMPFRFGRFADRVLGADHNEQERDQLSQQLDKLLDDGKVLRKLTEENDKLAVEEGFARLDALNRIGNQVFFTGLLPLQAEGFDVRENLAPNAAPVAYPHIWDASWFTWVQYNASIMQPMVRNAGEALGVSANVNLVEPDNELYRSAVQVREIFDMEQLLAGDDPFSGETGFKGLTAPDWPEGLLGEIISERRDRGQKLYQQLCQGCHLPSVDGPSGAFWSHTLWTEPNDAEERYLKVRGIAIDKVGTDPAQANVFIDRKVKVPAFLGINPSELCDGSGGEVVTETSFAEALAAVTEKTTTKWYDEHGVGPAERKRMNGNRPNCIRAKPIYKARPLDGIWATAPFLHNGSVPNLWALLSPAEKRPSKFCLGSRQFDPKHVGYSTECISGAFELDTSLAGNRNIGHEFKDGPLGNGTIGPALTDEERWGMIEFLKSL